MRIILVLTTFTMLLTSTASAARLNNPAGDVLVNTGRGFERGVAGQELLPGDRVMIGQAGGQAAIDYGAECVEPVEAGQLVTVRGDGPCAAKTSDITTGSVGAVGGLGALGGVSSGVMVAGGAAAAVGVGVGISSAAKSSKPSSN